MNLGLNEIFAVIDKVKCAELEGFEYSDVDMKIKIRNRGGRNINRDYRRVNEKCTDEFGYYGESVKITAEKKQEISAIRKEDRNQENETVSSGEMIFVESPMVGTFYAAPSEGAEPFVSVGDKVKKGQVIGIIEAMKLMNEIEAGEDGIVEEILVENEQLVEFGQPLVKLRK